MANYHDHVCPGCFTIWTHELIDCRVRDNSPESCCPQCMREMAESDKAMERVKKA